MSLKQDVALSCQIFRTNIRRIRYFTVIYYNNRLYYFKDVFLMQLAVSVYHTFYCLQEMMTGFTDDRARNPPPGLPLSWGVSGTDLVSLGITSEVFEEEEDPCVICHEEMTPPTTVMLECKHRFHDEVRDATPTTSFS